MPDPAKAIFISYASEDAEAARRICDALRGAGIEVWLDQHDLRGGDAWDASIRRQIKACALFVPVLSARTQERAEGYFRREWRLAVDRLQDLAGDIPFIVPVALGDTPAAQARVPEEFRAVQWLRLSDGPVPDAFVTRLQALLAARHDPVPVATAAESGNGHKVAGRNRRPLGLALAAVVVVVAFGLFWRPLDAPRPVAANPNSIAVLAFDNLSDDKENEFFSEGISEELLNVLAHIPDLKVSARTSAFSFKGRKVPIPEIARALGVAYVVEGSVRKAGGQVRVRAELISAADGFHVWAERYELPLDNIFAVQDQIAAAIVGELRRRLTGGRPAAPRRDDGPPRGNGGTRHAEAYRLHLEGRYLLNRGSPAEYRTALARLRRAVELDPTFAEAWADLARTHADLAQFALVPFDVGFAEARAAANRALELAPKLAGAHLALAHIQLAADWNMTAANASVRRALELAPGDAAVVSTAAMITLFVGRTADADELGRRAVELDPVNPQVRFLRAAALFYAHRAADAEPEIRRALELNPSLVLGPSLLAYICMAQGRFEEALAAAQREPEPYLRLAPVALVRLAQGRRPEADTALAELIRDHADRMAFNIAQIYAVRGEHDAAFAWLDRACAQRDSGLTHAKIDPFLERLHGDLRWPAFLQRLGLGDAP